MKASLKQYAVALHDLVEGKTEKEISVVLKSFTELLIKNNVSSKIEIILDEFSDIWNDKNGIVEVNVTTARVLDKTSKQAIIDYIKKTSKAKEVFLEEEVDKKILGGVVMKYGDKIVDSSLRARVKSLGRSLEK